MSGESSGNSEPINAITDDQQSVHPVHRCPIDVLQCIFENTLPPTPNSYTLHREHFPWRHAPQLRRLCLVCRHWRDVVLATPSLWTSICIDFNESVEELDSRWRQAIQRVKSAPAVVSFHEVGQHDYSWCYHPETTDPKLRERIEERFRLCSLRAIPRIRTLRFDVALYRYPIDVLSLMQEFPRYEIERLEIAGHKPGRGDDSEPEETWNTLLHRFPPFKSLEMNCVGPVIFSQSVPFVALVELDIMDAFEVNTTTIMAMCPNLRRLSIYSLFSYSTSDVSGTDPQRLTPHHLHFLKVIMVKNFPWDRLGQLPSLSELHFRADSQETTPPIDFIQAYTSLTSVSLHVDDPCLVQLALAAPQLTNIVIRTREVDLEAFLDWKAAGMNAPAFPMLQTIGFRSLHVTRFWIDLQDFEAFIRKRCLPNSHPECALEMVLHPVRQLHIRGKGEWQHSKYIADATLCQIREINTRSEVTLSWV